jgi:hypothetical protein
MLAKLSRTREGMKGLLLRASVHKAGRKAMSYLHRFGRLLAQVRRTLHGLAQSTAPDLTCERVVGLIADYLTGASDPETTAAFEEHLRGCDDCVAFLNTYRRTIVAVQPLRFEDVPAEMEERVRHFLRTNTRRSGHGR